MFTIYCDERVSTVAFGAQKLRDSLNSRRIHSACRSILEYDNDVEKSSLVVRFLPFRGIYLYKEIKVKHELKKGGYEIIKDGNVWLLNAYDNTGAMYGLFDIAETVAICGLEGIKEKVHNPFHEMRGIKFNWPYEPYDTGDPFEKNKKTVLDIEYWRSYIDFLAENRYNCLSLWSEHPYHMMFRLSKYPETCPYTDEELHRFQDVFRFIFRHAAERGINTYIITWNIRLTPFVAEGLGLPRELGEMDARYDLIADETLGKPNPAPILDEVRQHLPIIKDYIKECVKTLAATYEDLCGMGTTASEEMVGDTPTRVKWVEETYLKGLEESGRTFPFIFRTNMTSSQPIVDAFADHNKDSISKRKTYLSWKYSNAHMYSAIEPQFEKEWKAWDNVDLGESEIIYTVRNDDFHTFRGGSYDFLRAYIKGMKKPNVTGYYWGADGYIWGDDFQHVPHKHMTWKYDFERHWYEFSLLGRLGYDPDMGESYWQHLFTQKFYDSGKNFYQAYQIAGRILPPINRLFWINYDYEWHAESLLSSTGIKTVLDFADGVAMPGVGTLSILDSVKLALKNEKTNSETVYTVLEELNLVAQELSEIIKKIEKNLAKGSSGEADCTLLDMKAWLELCNFYIGRFNGAERLCMLRITKDEKYRKESISALKNAVIHWKKLADIWSSHYLPYMTVRSKYHFGYNFYTDDIERDVLLVKNERI